MGFDNEAGRWKRKRFAKDLKHALIQGMNVNKSYFRSVKFLIVPALAKGNNAETVRQFFMESDAKIIGIDPNVAPDLKLFENGDLIFIKDRFQEADLSLWSDKNTAIKAGNYLQLYSYHDKLNILSRMIEIVGPRGKIIIIDEVFADNFIDRLWDRILNKIYNFMVPGPYIRLSLEEYRRLFKECGLEIKYERNYNRRTFLWMLQVK